MKKDSDKGNVIDLRTAKNIAAQTEHELRQKELEKCVVDAALDLLHHMEVAVFKIPIPGSDPPQFVAGGYGATVRPEIK